MRKKQEICSFDQTDYSPTASLDQTLDVLKSMGVDISIQELKEILTKFRGILELDQPFNGASYIALLTGVNIFDYELVKKLKKKKDIILHEIKLSLGQDFMDMANKTIENSFQFYILVMGTAPDEL